MDKLTPGSFGFVAGGAGCYVDPWGRYRLNKKSRMFGNPGNRVRKSWWVVGDTTKLDCFNFPTVVAEDTYLAGTCALFAKHLRSM